MYSSSTMDRAHSIHLDGKRHFHYWRKMSQLKLKTAARWLPLSCFSVSAFMSKHFASVHLSNILFKYKTMKGVMLKYWSTKLNMIPHVKVIIPPVKSSYSFTQKEGTYALLATERDDHHKTISQNNRKTEHCFQTCVFSNLQGSINLRWLQTQTHPIAFTGWAAWVAGLI